jgi:hypothetical protein
MVHPLRYNSNVTDVIDEHSVQIDVIVGEVSSNCRNMNSFRKRTGKPQEVILYKD